ncbi:MAG TPA: hypothetical protein P5076_23590, partial [Myxococcota bacterium]|nr:hypothetical protein [Myxococcota bacterium]
MRRTSGILLGLGLVLGAGCGDYSNGSLAEDLAFLQAVPALAALELRVAVTSPRELDLVTGEAGLGARGQELLGEPAGYLGLARAVAAGVDRDVLGLLRQAEWLVRALPANARSAERRVWGPWPSDLPGVDMRLWLARAGQDRFGFHLQLRPEALRSSLGFDEGWSECLSGDLVPAPDALRRGRGSLIRDLTACSQATGSAERGLAGVAFDTRPDGDDPEGKTEVQVLFAGFLPAEELARGQDAHALDALYTYLERSDRSGALGLVAWTDLDLGEPLRPARERVALEARWDGAGA